MNQLNMEVIFLIFRQLMLYRIPIPTLNKYKINWSKRIGEGSQMKPKKNMKQNGLKKTTFKRMKHFRNYGKKLMEISQRKRLKGKKCQLMCLKIYNKRNQLLIDIQSCYSRTYSTFFYLFLKGSNPSKIEFKA